MYDFANILFSGPCNARCPFCIGELIDPALNLDNLDTFPPRNLDRFLDIVRVCGIRQLVITGTNTDPQLYQHEARLLARLREVLPADLRISLHTNGRLALRKMSIFNSYDRVSLSLPSFNPHTYRQVMGVSGVPDLAEILKRTRIPVKVSWVLTRHNQAELGCFLEACRGLGVRRVVLRKLLGDLRPWSELIRMETLPLVHGSEYRNNPVYYYNAMEVTLWDFYQSESRSINLFSSGLISPAYLLSEARAAESTVWDR